MTRLCFSCAEALPISIEMVKPIDLNSARSDLHIPPSLDTLDLIRSKVHKSHPSGPRIRPQLSGLKKHSGLHTPGRPWTGQPEELEGRSVLKCKAGNCRGRLTMLMTLMGVKLIVALVLQFVISTAVLLKARAAGLAVSTRQDVCKLRPTNPLWSENVENI